MPDGVLHKRIVKTYLLLPTLVSYLEGLLRLVAKLVFHDTFNWSLRPVWLAVGGYIGCRVETVHLTEATLPRFACFLRNLQIVVRPQRVVSSSVGAALCKYNFVQFLEILDVRIDSTAFGNFSHVELISLDNYGSK